MDKLKQTFSRNKDAEAEDTTSAGPTGKVTGQGSHFSSAKTMDRDTLGATAAAQQDSAVGGTSADPIAAQGTTGPEAGGREHVGTVEPGQLSQSTEPAGQTTTYSTHQLATGDPTSSVVDTRSSDPTTYKKPESNLASASEVGVPPNAAQVAASRAFSGTHGGESLAKARNEDVLTSIEGMPGAFPTDKYENPYKAENLDPRVDNLPIRSKDNATSGAATAAAASAVGGTASTSNKTEPTSAQDSSSSGFVGKALAAVGLGGAAGAAGYAATRDGKDSAVGDTPLPANATPKPTHGRKESIPTTAYPAGVDSPQAVNPPVGGTSQGTEAPRAAEESHTARNATLGAVGLGAAGAAGYGASQYAGRSDNDSSRIAPASESTLGRDNTDTLRDDLAGQPTGITSQAKTSASDPSTFTPATQTTLGQDNTSKLRDDLMAQPTGITQEAKDRASPASAAPVTSSVLPLTDQEEKEDHSKRNTALAAGGVGAAVGGAGAYAATRDNDKKDEPFGHTAIYGPADTPSTYRPSAPPTQPTSTSASGPHVAGSDSPSPTAATDTAQRKGDEDHTGRNAALAGAAGAGLVGAGAYGAHEASKKAAEEDAARQAAAAEQERLAAEKARADADKAHKKELEKQEKAAHKEEKKHAKEAEKAEKQAEKEEKKHQKEMEKQAKKEEKEHQKEVAALEKQRTKEEEEEERRKKAAAAASVGAAGAGAGAYAYDKSKEDESSTKSPTKSEKERKPGLFKRIFKRRKNKDTGESEEYSSEEEDKDDSHKGAIAGTAAGAGAVGAGTAYAAHERREDKPDSTSDPTSQNIGVARTTDEPTTRYEAASGGLQKPSYNPLAKDDPLLQQQQQESSPTSAAATTHQAQPLQYNNQRATSVTTDNDNRPIEPTTGLPFDPSKDHSAAHRLSEHDANMTPDSTARRTSSLDDNSADPGSPTSSKKGLRQKLKEKITGHKDEDGHEHEQHGVLHKKPHQVPEEVRGSMEGSQRQESA